jgi:hypothetical protein
MNPTALADRALPGNSQQVIDLYGFWDLLFLQAV